MAIQFARVDIISRKAGGSAVGIASYVSRSQRQAEGTGREYYFNHKKDDLVFHTVMTPENAPAWAQDGATLWNAAEACEKRKDSQLAKHMVLALPKELSQAEQQDLTERFIEAHFTKAGLAVEAAGHKPHKGEENFHAHLVISTRYLEAEGFGRKAVELNPGFAKGKNGRGFVSIGDEWGEKWAQFQNDYFKAHEIDLSVDAVSVQPGVHLKDSRFVDASAKVVENEARQKEALEIVRTEPEAVLSAITYHKSYFSERDVARYLFKAGLEGEEFTRVKTAVLASSLPLYERGYKTESGYYTTADIRGGELSVLSHAERLSQRSGHKLAPERALAAIGGASLSYEQKDAFVKAVEGGDLVLWRGVAGAGKSYAMNAVREAYVKQGYQVVGLAPTNTVARDMARDGFNEARTLHSFLGKVERGTQALNSRSVLMVDEAAMVSTPILERVLKHADDARAKVVLIGDDRQLASIERGGMFTELRERYGACELREIRRQKDDWSKEASLCFADGNFKDGLKAYAERGYIHWGESLEDAQKALVARWGEQYGRDPHKVRFVYAQTNAHVNALNAAVREKLKGMDALGEETVFDTVRGKVPIASGDRLQFYENDYSQGLFNGYCGTVQRIEGQILQVKLDHGKAVSVDSDTFKGFGHGYAGTVYRGQGKTQVETSYLHTPLSESRTSYVAMTRHQEACRVFVAKETTRNAFRLAEQMSRYVEKGSSLKYATRDEIQIDKVIDKKSQKEDLKENLFELLKGLKPIAQDKFMFKEAGLELAKLERQSQLDKLQKAAQSPEIQQALKQMEDSAQTRGLGRSAEECFKESERKLALIHQDHQERRKRHEVILPSEKQELLKHRQAYGEAFIDYARERPEQAGAYAKRICERFEDRDRRSLGARDKAQLTGAQKALGEAVKTLKDSPDHGYDKRMVKEWEETLKLQRSVERNMSRGFSMGL